MTGWSLATAAAIGALTMAIDQEPAIEVRAEPMQRTAVKARSNQQRVSVSFTNATVREVLDWLSKNDVSFVAAESEIAKDARITLNVKNQPIDAVADAIAEGLGGHWADRDGIKVFRKGMHMFPRAFAGPMGPDFKVPGMRGEDGMFKFEGPEGMKGFKFEHGKPGDPHLFRFEGPEGVREFRIEGKDGEPKVFRFKGPEGMKEFKLDELKELHKLHELQGPEGEKIRAKIHKDMEQLHKELPKMKLELEKMKDMKGLTDEERAKIEVEVEKSMKEARKAIDKARKEHPEAFEHRMFIGPEGHARVYAFGGEPGERMKVRAPMIPGEPFIARAKGGSMDQLVKSLSPEQQEKHRRQGFLKASDLSPRQKELLGFKDLKGNWTIRYSKDNKEVVIKSDE